MFACSASPPRFFFLIFFLNSSTIFTNPKQIIQFTSNTTYKYSGDHDMLIPYVGTITWIRYLNLTSVDGWRPWYVDGQVAGWESNSLFIYCLISSSFQNILLLQIKLNPIYHYCFSSRFSEKYSNLVSDGLTFATVKVIN